jgi:hypothetical protein
MLSHEKPTIDEDDDGGDGDNGKHIRSQTHIGFPTLQMTNDGATCPQTSALLPAKLSSTSDVEPCSYPPSARHSRSVCPSLISVMMQAIEEVVWGLLIPQHVALHNISRAASCFEV